MLQGYNKQLLHREASILLPEQFEDWEEVKVNIVVVSLFTYITSMLGSLEGNGSHYYPWITILEGAKKVCLLDNNLPLQEL